jgi:hypothetical protein
MAGKTHSRQRLLRLALLALSLLALALAAIALLPQAALAGLLAARPLPPIPPPPTILAPQGALPGGEVAWPAWARYADGVEERAGSGFLLQLADGRVVGVITAHSLSLQDPQRIPDRIQFGAPGEAAFAAAFEGLLGEPGRARTGADLTVDYILLEPAAPVDPALALEADPRGGPQPGERVTLYSGAGDGGAYPGAILSAAPEAAWAVMDATFDPGLMSGSPLVSQHTGLVVGMAIAAAPRGGRLTLGFHPIGSLVRLAEAAAESQALAG